jgi:hypothetical protein
MSCPKNTNCSGCPHCDASLAALMKDFHRGDFRAASMKLATLTQRTLRALTGRPIPPPPDLGEALRASRQPVTDRDERIAATVRASQSPIGPRPSEPRTASAPVPAPPDLAAAIRQSRGGN